LAGPVLAGNENLALSLAILTNGNLSRDESFTIYRNLLSRLFGLIKEGMSTTSVKEEALELAADLTPHFFNDSTKIIMGGADHVTPEELVNMLSSPCLTAPFTHDPQDYLPKVKCPMLALYGAKDVHVPAPEHIIEIKRILKGSRNIDYATRELPDTNHLFQKCQTGFPVEYQTLDHDISPEVLEVIGSWILEKTRSEEE
jgi:hypothetical protein